MNTLGKFISIIERVLDKTCLGKASLLINTLVEIQKAKSRALSFCVLAGCKPYVGQFTCSPPRL